MHRRSARAPCRSAKSRPCLPSTIAVFGNLPAPVAAFMRASRGARHSKSKPTASRDAESLVPMRLLLADQCLPS